MAERTPGKINSAVRGCLDECFWSELPLRTLARQMDLLRVNPNWTAAEVDEVETIVLRVLNQVLIRH